MSRIEQLINEIEEYIDSCKFQPLSTSKIIVNKEELDELLVELRLRIPDEIKQYQKIISNKDAILADAQSKADAIIADAKTQAQQMVTESEVMQQAYAQANEVVMIATKQAQEILDNATNDANNIRMGAMQYTDDILKNLESTISHAMDSSKARSDAYMSTLQGFLDVVTTNRAELNPTADIQEETQTDTQELQQTMPEQQ